MLIQLFGKKKLRAVFFGTPEFSLPTLEEAAAIFDLKAVVTQPDRPRGRGHKVLPCPVKEAALRKNLRAFSPESLRKESDELKSLQEFLRTEKIDIFIVIAYGNILPQWILDVPRLGAVNLHGSLLPRWRGAAPIQRALEAGDNSTGVSLQKMVFKLDAGDVLFESKHLIGPLEDAASLTEALSQLSARVLREYFTNEFKKVLVGQVQDESLVNHAAKITKEEAQWTPAWTATQTHNKVRAFSVWPQVKATLSTGEAIAITKTTLNATYNGTPLTPGQIQLSDGRVFVGSAAALSTDPVLELLEIKPANKGSLRAWDYLQNHAAQDSLTLQ